MIRSIREELLHAQGVKIALFLDFEKQEAEIFIDKRTPWTELKIDLCSQMIGQALNLLRAGALKEKPSGTQGYKTIVSTEN